jgi:glycerol-3-phosphate dehydrogenase
MKRDLQLLDNRKFDVLVVGGGIYGAAIAYEASSRGLAVALIEKDDFCAATSANSLKIIHGGLRYLQHGDWQRARRSIQERRTLLRIAPHLVRPLPVLIPTYGYGLKGRPVLACGLLLNDLVGLDRNRGLSTAQSLPRGYTVGTKAAINLLPGLSETDLTGAACFYDAFVHNSERLVLAYLQSAVAKGAVIANYAEVVDWLREGSHIAGANVEDRLNGASITVRAGLTVNATGPWANNLWPSPVRPSARVEWSKAFNLVIKRPLFANHAVGLSGQNDYQDSDTLLKQKGRFFFIVPWRNRAMIGTEYVPYEGDPADFAVTEAEIEAFLMELNRAYPPAKLTLDDVAHVQAGLVPITGITENGSVRLAKQGIIVDHRQDGITGCLSAVGVKYTTARAVAEEVIDLAFDQWGKQSPAATTAVTPLVGGNLTDVAAYVAQEAANEPAGLNSTQLEQLVDHYGTQYRQLLPYLQKRPAGENGHGAVSPNALLRAQVWYAVEHEMARRLADVVFRRTELGSAGHPGQEKLRCCAQVMAEALNWTTTQTEAEINHVETRFAWHYAHDRGRSAVADTAV